MAHDVFISYSDKDSPIADALCSTLEAGEFRCWITPRDVLPGMDWGEAIIDAIAASRVMVLLLSTNSNTSTQVKREVERAVNKNVMVIPLRIDNVTLSKSLEYHLSTTHWMDALTPPLEKHLQTLAKKLRQVLSISTRTAPKPIPSTSAKRDMPLPAPNIPQRVTLTIQLDHYLIANPVDIILDGKQIGQITVSRERRILWLPPKPGETHQLSVETTTGMHILEFKAQTFRPLKGHHKLDLSSSGNYRAFFSGGIGGFAGLVKFNLIKERA